MNSVVTTFTGLAVLATSYAVPIGDGFAGISLTSDSLNSFYNQDVTSGDFPFALGFGYEKDGTISAGISSTSKFLGKALPIAVSVSGQPKNLKKTFQMEIATRLLDYLSGVVQSDGDGIKWLTSLWVPVRGLGALSALGASVEIDKRKPIAISGGIGINGNIYQSRVALDDERKPNGVNFFALSKLNAESSIRY